MDLGKLTKQIDMWYNCWFRLRGAYQAWADEHGIPYNTLFVIREISLNPNGCTQKKICDGIVLSKQTVSAILAKLEESGLIYRKSDEGDKRNNLVSFTEKGLEYSDSILTELLKSDIKTYGNIGQSDLQKLIEGGSALADEMARSFYHQKNGQKDIK